MGRAHCFMNKSFIAGYRWNVILFAILMCTILVACDRTRTITASGDPPVIQSFTADPPSIFVGQSSLITVTASNPNGGVLTYEWDAGLGAVVGQGSEVLYTAQWCCVGRNNIFVRVINEAGGAAVATIQVISLVPPK